MRGRKSILLILATALIPSFSAGSGRPPTRWEWKANWTFQLETPFADAYARYEARPLSLEDMRVGSEIEGHIALSAEPKMRNYQTHARWAYVESLYPLISRAFGPFPGPLHRTAEKIYAGTRFLLAVDRDETIKAPDGRLDLEINAPVLTRATFGPRMTAFLAGLAAHDFQFTKTSALHVHVEYPAGEVSTHELALLNDLFHVLQRQLFARFAPHPERAEFIEPLGAVRPESLGVGRVLDADGSPLTYRDEPLEVAWHLRLSKHSAFLDIAESLEHHGTIELRLINGSFDRGPSDFAYGADLLTALIWALRTQEPRLRDYLTTTLPEEIQLAKIDEILGLTAAVPFLGIPEPAPKAATGCDFDLRAFTKNETHVSAPAVPLPPAPR